MSDRSPVTRLHLSWYPSHRRSREMGRLFGAECVFVAEPGPLPVRYARQWLRTRRLVRERRPDVIIVMQPPVVALLCVAVHARQATIVGDLHSGVFSDRRWRWALPLVTYVLRSRGLAIVPNAEVADACSRRRVDAAVVPAGITAAPPRTLGADREHPIVLVPLTYSFDEPIDSIIEAASLVPEARWLLTGKTPSALESAAPTNIEFTGYLDDRTYEDLRLSASVICALTTEESTMQSAGFEALASATPLVTSPTRVLRAYFENAAEYANPTPTDIARAVRSQLAAPAQWSQRMADLRTTRIDEQVDGVAAAERLIHTSQVRGRAGAGR